MHDRKLASTTKILVIVVTYNGMQWIERCIRSVEDGNLKADIFIIDNGSTDGTIEYIKSNYKYINLYISKENLGFGKANNIGLRYAVDNNYDYAYLLNQDAWVSTETFETLVDLNKNNPEFGILSPIQINANGALDRNFAYCCPNVILSDFFNGTVNDIYEVAEVMAAHWLISRECLLTVGGFSPAFPHYGEDNNYIQRASLNGFKTGIATSTKCVHDRENRPLSKSQIIYRQYIAAISDYSNPLQSQSIVRIMLWQFVKNAFTMKSFRPFKYMVKFLLDSKSLIHIKKESLNKYAFL